MKIYSTKADIEYALHKANEFFAGNLRFDNFTPMNKINTRYLVTLKVHSSKGPGSARSPHDGKRRLPRACWHAHGIFFDMLPEGTIIKTKMAIYRAKLDPWHDAQVGSRMQPFMASQLCECEDSGIYEDYLKSPERRYRGDKVGRLKCYECGELIGRQDAQPVYLFDNSPWDEHGTAGVVHPECFDKLYDTGWADFRFFDCPSCNRTIIRQCPQNGWRSYVKVWHGENDDEEICVKCYQDRILKEGIPRRCFEGSEISGDFFNYGELEKAGYKKHGGQYFINSSKAAETFNKEALEYIKQGSQVVVNFERLGIGGGEGYISLYTREV